MQQIMPDLLEQVIDIQYRMASLFGIIGGIPL